MTIYQHIRHPHITSRLGDRPVRVLDMLPRGTAINRFNTKVAILTTQVVGSMWCAYAFGLFDLISLPSAIPHAGASADRHLGRPDRSCSWCCCQSIMVGQNVQAAAADKRAEATFHDASATLHEMAHVQGHLAAQDELLSRIAERIGLEPVPVIDVPPDDTIKPGDETWFDDETAGQDS